MSGISNVKISVVFHSFLPISHFVTEAISHKAIYSFKRNFLVIKDYVTITIFKKTRNRYHLNVTGIKKIQNINSTINLIKEKYCPPTTFEYLYHKIDNLTATYSLGYRLPLQKIALSLTPCSYNTERFPGLHIKSEKGGVIIFESGKVNILGYTTKEEIEKKWKIIQQRIQHVMSMNMT